MEKIHKTLKKHGIPYEIRRGISGFTYTAFVFPSKTIAWKAYDLLGFNGTGIDNEGFGRYSIKLYI